MTMAEYLDKEAFKKSVEERYCKPLDNLAEGFTETDRVIREMPTVDAEVVVRCKDCKHYDMGVCLKIYSDGNVHPEAWQSRKPEDFCSYGERREAKT